MNVNGYEITIKRIPKGEAKGQYRATLTLNGNVAVIGNTRKAALTCAEFLAERISLKMYEDLASRNAVLWPARSKAPE